MLNTERHGGWGTGGPTNTPANAFGQPAPLNPFSHIQPNGQTTAQNTFGNGTTSVNPFLSGNTSARTQSASPAFGQPSNAAQKPHNPFDKSNKAAAPNRASTDTSAPKQNPFSAPPTSNSSSSAPNSKRKVAEFVQPAWPNKPSGGSPMSGAGSSKGPPNGKRKSDNDFQGRSKFSRNSPDPKLASKRSSSGPPPPRGTKNTAAWSNLKSSPNDNGRSHDLAAKIQQQLAKDGIKPPSWPANPGSLSQRQAVEALRESHKAYREKARKSLIRAGLIDDPDEKRTLDKALIFRGISEDMCPEWERITRIVELDIKLAEKEVDDNGDLVAKPHLMVKRLARSAAGQDAPLPMDVRSFPTLRKTLDYLIDDLIPSDNLLPLRHNFLWDRTRAIRIDLSVQKYSMTSDERKDLIYCLETIARFHVTSLHLLSQEGFAQEDFSEQQEIEQLGKTLMSLKELYDDCAQQGIECQNEAEFRGYYVVFNAHNPEIKEIVQGWGTRLWNSDGIRTAMCLVESMENSWRVHGPLTPYAPSELALSVASMFFSIVAQPQISYTMACFAEIHFNGVRKSILQVIRKAYSRPRDGPKDITPAFLRDRMHFDTEEEAIDFVQKHGFEFNGEGDQQYLVVNTRQQFADARIPHSFSQTIVERKRCGRSLPDVIHHTVYEDIREASSDVTTEENLLVPETSNASPRTSDGPALGSNAQSVNNTPLFSPPVTASPLENSTENIQKHTTPSIFAQPGNTAPSQSTNLFNPTTSRSLSSITNLNPSTRPGDVQVSEATDQPSGYPSAGPIHRPKKGDTKKRVTFDGSAFGDGAPSSQTDGAASGLFGFLNNKDSKNDSSPAAINPNTNLFSGVSSTTSSDTLDKNGSQQNLFPTASASAALGFQYPIPQPPSATAGQPLPTKEQTDSSVYQKPTVKDGSSSEETLPTDDGSAKSQPGYSPLLVPNPLFQGMPPPPVASNVSLKTPATSASLPTEKPTPTPEIAPKADPMGDFTRWFVCADKGLMEDYLEQFMIEQVLKDTWNNFQELEEERQRKEEDEKSWAEARKFREYSLKVTYFYRWLDTTRKRRVIKRIQMEKEKARQWKLPENVAKRELAAKREKEKAIQEAKDLVQKRSQGNIAETARLRESTRSRQEDREDSVEAALLATGVFRGVRDEKAAARYAAREDEDGSEQGILPAEKMLLRSENQRRRKRGLLPLKRFPEPKAHKEGSKTAMLKALSTGAGRDSLSRSTGSLRNSTFSSSYRSSIGYNSSRVSKSQSKVTDPYWRLKANGLVLMPNGEYLHESLALPMLQEGKRFPGLGDYGLPPVESATPSVSPPPGSFDYSFQGGLDILRTSRSPSVSECIQKRKRGGEDEDEDLSAYRKEAPAHRKRARSGEGDTQSTSSDQDFLSSIANLMKEVDDFKKSTCGPL
ncbi:SAC3/GANP/Nin1/mts3/eIF-3 p25 family-domain-containing protein [Biscogniauxia sp. FL1348]|nr:SAC3/GANP/Nin1/mts3/eIF-3 p25 family-domain-containing protein [Biscogniauxia sp. FL1348]